MLILLLVGVSFSLRGDSLSILKSDNTCCSIFLSLDKEKEEEMDSLKPEQWKSTVKNVVGKWESSVYPFETVTASKEDNLQVMDGAYLKIAFFEDGSYVKSLGTAKQHVKEQGTWTISGDGKYLLFYCKGSEHAQKAKIKYLQMDELVLEHALKSSNDAFNTSVKDFYFNKQ